jgi:hypothetical protein
MHSITSLKTIIFIIRTVDKAEKSVSGDSKLRMFYETDSNGTEFVSVVECNPM